MVFSKVLILIGIFLNFIVGFLITPSLLGRQRLRHWEVFFKNIANEGKPTLKNFMYFENIPISDEDQYPVLLRIKFMFFEFLYSIPAMLIIIPAVFIILYCCDYFYGTTSRVGIFMTIYLNSNPIFWMKVLKWSYLFLFTVPILFLWGLVFLKFANCYQSFMPRIIERLLDELSKFNVRKNLLNLGVFFYIVGNIILFLGTLIQ
ncbi:MAG TPA: hypothetical protein DCX03_06830 [Bacteroidales bacterium]|nr:hypothetical protein [Bacteroidales bacterium]